jgi:hypothetical protein
MIEHPVPAFHIGASRPYPRSLLAPARPLGCSIGDVVLIGYVGANSLAHAVVESVGAFACH